MRALPLDILRIILCLMVIDFHYGKLIGAGVMAVIGFFVLSGYFLEKEFEHAEELNLPRFYKKKALHLLPEYVVATALAVIVTVFFPSLYTVDFSEVKGSSFVLMSFLDTANNPAWFLSCLFLFLALAPLLFCLHRLPWGIALMFTLSLAYSAVLYQIYGLGGWLYESSQVCITYFLGGMLARQLGRLLPTHPAARGTLAVLCVAGLLCFLPPATWAHALKWKVQYHYFIICGLFMLLVPTLHAPSPTSTGWQRAVVWLSSLTYAMYLFHAPVKRSCICLLTHMTGEPEEQILTPTAYALFFLLTVATASMFQNLKARIIHKRPCTQSVEGRLQPR